MQATECFNISVLEGATVVTIDNRTGTRAIVLCSVLKEKKEVVESSVVIVAAKFLQQDFCLIVVLESQVPPHVFFFPKKTMDEILFPQKCIFTARWLVAISRIRIQIMETIFFIYQSNRIMKTYIL